MDGKGEVNYINWSYFAGGRRTNVLNCLFTTNVANDPSAYAIKKEIIMGNLAQP